MCILVGNKVGAQSTSAGNMELARMKAKQLAERFPGEEFFIYAPIEAVSVPKPMAVSRPIEISSLAAVGSDVA